MFGKVIRNQSVGNEAIADKSTNHQAAGETTQPANAHENNRHQEFVQIPSSRSVTATANLLEELLTQHGFTVFLRLDQQAVAKKVGMSMKPTQVILFGKPEIGTQLMNEYPSMAMELPLKLTIQEERLQTASINMVSPQVIAQRNGIQRPIFKGLIDLIKQAAQENFSTQNRLAAETAVH